MIRNDHVQPERIGVRHTVDAGNTVIHGDQQIGLAFRALCDQIDDGGCEAVTQLETIRHEITHPVGLCA